MIQGLVLVGLVSTALVGCLPGRKLALRLGAWLTRLDAADRIGPTPMRDL